MTAPAPSGIRTETDGNILIVTIDRPAARNAVDRPTADALYEAFKAFDADEALPVAMEPRIIRPRRSGNTLRR